MFPRIQNHDELMDSERTDYNQPQNIRSFRRAYCTETDYEQNNEKKNNF